MKAFRRSKVKKNISLFLISIMCFLLLYLQLSTVFISKSVRVEIGDRTVVAQGDSVLEMPWGYFQFPKLFFTKDRKICCRIANKPDSRGSYTGKYLYYLSDDDGNTWYIDNGEEPPDYSLLMSNGCYFQGAEFTDEYESDIEKKYKPAFISEDGKTKYYYAEEVDRIVFPTTFMCSEYNPETDAINYFSSSIEWPKMPIIVTNGKTMPLQRVLYHFKMHSSNMILKEKDNNLFMAVYSDGFDAETGNVVYGKHYNLYFFRSSDNARSWHFVSQIATLPEYCSEESEGFCEPSIIRNKDDSYFVIMRTGSGLPGFCAYSNDHGTTWEHIEQFSQYGCDPQIVRLDNGITMASYGRPGIYIRLSEDEKCSRWEKEIRIDDRKYTELKDSWSISCCYSSLLPLDENTALIAYSDFQWPNNKDISTNVKTILVKRIHIEKR